MVIMTIIILIVIGIQDIHTIMETTSIIVMWNSSYYYGGYEFMILYDYYSITIPLITMEGIITIIITEIIMDGTILIQLILQIMYLDTEEVFLEEIDT